MEYIDSTESVTQKNIKEADIREAESLETNMELMMRLIDLIFLGREGEDIPS